MAACQALPALRRRFGPKNFTQSQLATCLVALVVAALALALTVYKGGAGAATAPSTPSSARGPLVAPESVQFPGAL